MQTEVYQSGQMNLLFYPELEQGGVRRIMNFFEQKRDLVELLTQRPGRVTVLIGEESGQPELRSSSVVVSRYGIGTQDAGALAVLGPIRMDYGKIVAVLRYLDPAGGTDAHCADAGGIKRRLLKETGN